MSASRLQHALKKKQPFESAAQEAALNLLRTSDQLQIRFTRLFREHGVTPAQYNILRILRGEGKPLPILEIASRTVTVVPGITGLIDRLQQAELVERIRCEHDRRVVYVAVTPRGMEVLAALDEPVVELHQKLLGHLGQKDLRELNRLLDKARTPWGED
ncbi:MAG: MarR family winged helix-turn-helix transcriptional regulator [Pirellulales bacterium]